MKELKTYAHLYLGCEINILHRVLDDTEEAFVERGKLVGITESEVERGKLIAIFDINSDSIQECYLKDVTLILRPLSELTEDEAIEIAEIMYGQPDSIKWRMEDKGDYFNVYRKHYGRSFTIDKASGDIDRYEKIDIVNEAGDRSEVSELETTLNHHIITAYMLSRGFDLFGLIDSGLAVSKTETKN